MLNVQAIPLRVTFGFIILLILVRIIGNKQLGQLNVFTYISGIVIGSMVSDIILHSDIPFWPSMLGVMLWVGLAILVELAALKSVRVREALDGQPIILIKKGEIQQRALKKERLNIDDLTMMLRTNNVFSITDVDYAILEPNGDLSILKQELKESVTKADMNIKPTHPKYMPSALITDGRFIKKNLRELNLSEEYVFSILNDMNINDAAKILYAEIQKDGQLHVQLREAKQSSSCN